MIRWQNAPFVRMAIPFSGGVITAVYWDGLAPMPTIIAMALTAIAALTIHLSKVRYLRRWMFGVPITACFLFWGYLTAWRYAELHDQGHFQCVLPSVSSFAYTWISGVVIDRSDRKNNVRLVVQTQSAGTAPDSTRPCSGAIMAYVRKDTITGDAGSAAAYGDTVYIKARVHRLDPPGNPKAFDYSRYLHFQNIHYQAFIASSDIRIQGIGGGNPLIRRSLACRDQLVALIKKTLPTESEYAVGAALTLGYKEAISDEVQNAYIETGAMHILAVSGMHVGLIYLALIQFFKLFPSGRFGGRTLKAVVALTAVWGFTFLTGSGGSILRASAMFTFLCVGEWFRRRTNIYNTLAVSAFSLFVWNPLLLFDVGFQLSYMAVAGIIYFYPKIYKVWKIKNRVGDWAWQTTALGCAAQIATLPLSLFYFHQFPTYFWLSGLLVIPVSIVALYAGIAMFFLQWSAWLTACGAKIFYVSVWLMNEIIFLIQRLPAAVVTGVWLSLTGAVALYAALLTVAGAIQTRKARMLFPALGILLALSFSYAVDEYQRLRQKQLLVYSINKGTLVDFFIGKKRYSLENGATAKDKLKYSAASYRSFMGADAAASTTPDAVYRSDTFYYTGGVAQFMGKKIAMIDDAPYPLGVVDYAVVYGNPTLDLDDLSKTTFFKILVFDVSNSAYKVKTWKEACRRLHLPYYDVAEKGAFIQNL